MCVCDPRFLHYFVPILPLLFTSPFVEVSHGLLAPRLAQNVATHLEVTPDEGVEHLSSLSVGFILRLPVFLLVVDDHL